MHFTIRHLFWFTLLAAVACWWWLPSSNDATSLMGNVWCENQFLRFKSEQNSAFKELYQSAIQWSDGWAVGLEIDFARRDAVLFPATFIANTMDQNLLELQSRAQGWIVIVCAAHKTLQYPDMILVAKHAHIFQLTPTQFYLIDVGVAAGLLTLAIGSLFVGRKRRAVLRTSAQPVSN